MKAVYPIIMTKYKREYYPYYINIPDFNCAIHASDVSTGMKLARKKIAEKIIKLQSTNQKVPCSNYVIPTLNHADIITLIDVDTDDFQVSKKNKKLFGVF